MLRLTAERPDHWTRGGASTDHQSAKDIGVRDCSTKTAVCPFSRTTFARSAPQHRRWTGRPRRTTVLSDVAVWTFYFLLTAAGLLALCVVLTLAWPTP